MQNPFQDLSDKLQGIETLLQEIRQPHKTQEQEQLLTREETCNMLKMNKATLWKHTKQGKLKSYGIGRRVYYKRSEVLNSLTPLKK